MSAAADRLGISSLSWGLPPNLTAELDRSVFSTKGVARRSAANRDAANREAEAAEHWSLNSGAPAARLEDALTCLAWAYRATEVPSTWDESLRAKVLSRIDDWQAEIREIRPNTQPLAHFWLNVELPLVRLYATSLSRSEAEDESRRIADQLAAAWPAWLDGEGLPRSTAITHAWGLLASWLRCGTHWRTLALPGWTDNLFEQYDVFLQQALRLLRNDGSVIFEPATGVRPSREFVATALEFVARAETQWFAACAGVFPERQVPAKAKLGTPLVSEYADAVGVAVLRSDWENSSVQAALTYHGAECRCELSTGKQPLVSGLWRFDITLDGELCPPQGPWREVVWFSDEEVDYLEIEIDLTETWRVQRQLLLYRPERLLYLADAVLGEVPGEIEYRGYLPLRDGVRYEPAVESHEGRFTAGKSLATVLPLALPEWRAEASPGEVSTDGESLVSSMRGRGHGVYMPLVVACQRSHLRPPYTWRRLTVAESLQPVPSHVACGYRTQFGKGQLLFYRSLAPAANRTVLGQNVACDFLAAEFKSDGTARPIVRIET